MSISNILRRFLSSRTDRLLLAERVTAIAIFSSLLITYQLWVGSDHFPKAPFFDIGQSDVFFFGIALISLCVSLCWYRTQSMIWIFVASLAVLVIGDSNRLQPWILQEVLLLVALSMPLTLEHSKSSVFQNAQLLMAFVPFWSGLQKLNMPFLKEIFISQTLPLHAGSSILISLFGILAYVVPVYEAFFGIGLLFKKTRTVSLAMAVGMHVFILILYGPFGWGNSHVVLIWNLMLLPLYFLLFFRIDEFSMPRINDLKKPFTLVLLFFLILIPANNFFLSKGDSYLSWSMVSGRIPMGYMLLSPRDAEKTSSVLKKNIQLINGEYVIDLLATSVEMQGVTIYPEVRVYKKVAAEFCVREQYSPDSKLIIYIPERFSLAKHTIEFGCNDL